MSDCIPIAAFARSLAQHKGYKHMAALVAAWYREEEDPWPFPFAGWLKEHYPALKVVNILRLLPQRYVCRLAGEIASVYCENWEAMHRLFWIIRRRGCDACKVEVLRSSQWIDFGTASRRYQWAKENWCSEQRSKVQSRACDLMWDAQGAHIGIRRRQP